MKRQKNLQGDIYHCYYTTKKSLKQKALCVKPFIEQERASAMPSASIEKNAPHPQKKPFLHTHTTNFEIFKKVYKTH